MKKSSRLFAWHHWLGLISGLLLLVVSVSGAVLVFHKEIDALAFPEVAKFSEPVESLHYDKALASVLERYPFHKLRLHLQDDPIKKAMLFEARGQESQRLVYVHPQSGQILHDIERFSTPSRWLLKLHYTLFMGITGNFLLALLGISMILSLATGLLVYRRRLLPVLLFREKFSLRSKRTFYSGTHRYLGVWSLLFNLLLVLTGIWIQVVIIGVNLSAPEAAAPAAVPMVSLDKVMRVLEAKKESFTPAFIALPADSLSPVAAWGKSRQTNPILPAYADVLKIETAGYTALPLELVEAQTLGKRLYSWVIALHFGSFGGLPVKLLYFLFGLTPAWLSISGWFLYRRRKKARKKQVELAGKRTLKKETSFA